MTLHLIYSLPSSSTHLEQHPLWQSFSALKFAKSKEALCKKVEMEAYCNVSTPEKLKRPLLFSSRKFTKIQLIALGDITHFGQNACNIFY